MEGTPVHDMVRPVRAAAQGPGRDVLNSTGANADLTVSDGPSYLYLACRPCVPIAHVLAVQADPSEGTSHESRRR